MIGRLCINLFISTRTGCLYTRAPKDEVHSLNSRIVPPAIRKLKECGKVVDKKPDQDSDGSMLPLLDKGKGIELSQFLIWFLKESRSQVMDGSDDLKEQLRMFQCRALNCIISVISCVSDKETHYNIIFKEVQERR